MVRLVQEYGKGFGILNYRNFKWAALFLVLIFAAGLVVGCGSSTDTKTTSSSTSKSTSTSSSSTSTAKGFEKDPNTTISTDKAVYKAGETIVVTWTAPASYSGYAWIGVVPSGIKHGSENDNDSNDTDYFYMEGKASGQKTLKAPDAPGDYDVRMNSDEESAKGKEVNYASFKVQ